MKEITVEEVQRKAKSWQAQGKKWHFHMLTPECVFNERDDAHAFVLENMTDNKTYVAYSTGETVSGAASTGYAAVDLPIRYMEIGEELVKLLYGDSILDMKQGTTASTNKEMQMVLDRAKELNEKGIPWHSHLLVPGCMFNQQQNKWGLVFEDSTSDDAVVVRYDQDPVDDLRRIEVLYYEQEQP
jgi:hypothetical protein